MGTNYYLHLGKRTSQGEGEPSKFTWAVNRHFPLVGDVPMNIAPGTVQDEYGREMSWIDFYEMIGRDVSDESHIGEQFS
jgi:hypothetical protein